MPMLSHDAFDGVVAPQKEILKTTLEALFKLDDKTQTPQLVEHLVDAVHTYIKTSLDTVFLAIDSAHASHFHGNGNNGAPTSPPVN
jgi:hypothetical protein